MSDPLAAAQEAGLRYVSDSKPGFRREKAGDGYRYLDLQGKVVRDAETLARIKALAIPPAWTDVWICPTRNGHLQATGRDARGRKQYKYHAKWREARDETKFHHSIAFAKALPKIRQRVEHDLCLPGLPREKVLAAVTRLLEITLIRVGNEEYAKQNNSFGLTTLLNRHVDVEGAKIYFHFRGKSSKQHKVDITDRRLSAIVRKCQALPGQDLFEYLDDDGRPQSIDSSDVNSYLKEITGEDFTAKDFRTWQGTVLAALALQELGECSTGGEVKSNIKQAVESVAARLGNTAAICKKCYVNPLVLQAYADGALCRLLKKAANGSLKGLAPAESATLKTLERLTLNRGGDVQFPHTPAKTGNRGAAGCVRK